MFNLSLQCNDIIIQHFQNYGNYPLTKSVRSREVLLYTHFHNKIIFRNFTIHFITFDFT